MSTPFEQGRKDGQWTQERIDLCGFGSAKEQLAHQEQVLDANFADLADLHKRNPRYADKQAEYLHGVRVGMHESLRRLVE